MRALFLVILVLIPCSVLACANKVDPNKVILFIDTNNSALEIATAQKSACARGERVVVVPKNYKEYEKYIKAEAWDDLTAFRNTQPHLKEALRATMEELKKEQAKLVNVTISGHDGGGSYSGHKGHLSRGQLAEVITDYPELNEVQSLLLLGCYTGTQHEVMGWKSIFPDSRLIAGYDGSAPLSHRPQGHQYISDILNKEKQLISQADEKKLKSFLNANIKGLNSLTAAMYLQCSDDSELSEYYYGTSNSRGLVAFDTQECLAKKDELEELSLLIDAYTTGELEPPKDTQNGELRALYNKARADEHCIEFTGAFVDTNALFNLLFNEGVEQSFAHYYKDDLEEVEKYLQLDPEEMEKNFNAYITKREEEAKREEELADLLEGDPESYFAQQKVELAGMLDEIKKKLDEPSFTALKDFVNLSTGEIKWERAGNELPEESNQRLDIINNKLAEYRRRESRLKAEKQAPGFVVKQRRQNAEMIKQEVTNSRLAFIGFKDNLNDPTKKIWIPNADNLKKKTRGELLNNLHRLNGIMSMNVLGSTQTKAATWLSHTVSNHLQYFSNPFSWHEFTGQVEPPESPLSLKSYMGADHSHIGGGWGMGRGSSSADW